MDHDGTHEQAEMVYSEEKTVETGDEEGKGHQNSCVSFAAEVFCSTKHSCSDTAKYAGVEVYLGLHLASHCEHKCDCVQRPQCRVQS